MQWHQLDHMQVCTSLQTDNQHPPISFFTGWMPPNHQHQSTEGSTTLLLEKKFEMRHEILYQ